MAKKLDLTRLRELRERQGLSPNEFWPHFGIRAGTGARYEHGHSIAKPVALLLYLLRSDQVALAGLAEAMQDLSGTALSTRQLDLARPRELRHRHKLSQHSFWRLVGVAQSVGSRYEKGRPIPKPVALLIYLWHSGKVTDGDLIEAAAALPKRDVDGNTLPPWATRYPTRSRADPVEAEKPKTRPGLDSLRELREWYGLSQSDFWRRFGAAPCSGSCYERGQPVPKPLALLLHFWDSGKLMDDDLIDAREPKKPGLDAMRELRERSGLIQRDFWRRFGITQNGGSYYEAGRALPKPLALLMSLWHSGRLTDEDLLIAGKTLVWRRRKSRSGAGQSIRAAQLNALSQGLFAPNHCSDR